MHTDLAMGIALITAVLIVLAVVLVNLRGRLEEIEARLRRLELEQMVRPEGQAIASVQPAPAQRTEAEMLLPPPRSAIPVQAPHPTEAPAARSTDWETILGGDWLNKLGVLIFVIGLALALGYSFTRLGPAGRVGISLIASFAMLIAGMLVEPRERYRNFARGLLGGGWAGLYTTAYAMQAIPAALVIHSPLIGALLLLTVAAGMIAHSLRYRSQTVTALAYFIAFVTLAITQITWLTTLALMPLAASLLFVAQRLDWRKIAIFGLLATWSIALLRGDTSAPLWQAQAVIALYWVVFEIFDLLRPDLFLLPINATGALGLSLFKWQSAAPGQLWQFFAASAAVFLVSTVLRAMRRAPWRPAATVASALAVGAIFLRLHHQWIALGLLVEAELIYLTGWRLQLRYLKALGTVLAALHVGYLLIAVVGTLPPDAWVPLAAFDAAVFYANRMLAADVVYGFAGAGMLALIAGHEFGEPAWGRAWLALAAAAFMVGWWRREFDFRAQGYALAVLGATASVLYAPHPPLALVFAAGVGYAAAWAATHPELGRLGGQEADLLSVAGSIGGTFFVWLLLWVEVSGSMLTVAWGIQGAVLLAAGFPLRDRMLRLSGLALLFLCILKLFLWDLRELDTLPRIFSFLVLGLILVGVSWVYTRFRERVARYL